MSPEYEAMTEIAESLRRIAAALERIEQRLTEEISSTDPARYGLRDVFAAIVHSLGNVR